MNSTSSLGISATYRFSRRMPYLLGILAAVFFGMPFFPGFPGANPSLVVLMGLVLATLAVASYLYTVTIESGTVTVGAFRRRCFLIAEIAKIEVLVAKGSATGAAITLRSGKRVFIDVNVLGFRELIDDLGHRAGVIPY
jgi:hypothetical protein